MNTVHLWLTSGMVATMAATVGVIACVVQAVLHLRSRRKRGGQ